MQIAVSAPKFYSSTKNIRHSHPPKKIMAALDPRVAVQQILNEKLDHSEGWKKAWNLGVTPWDLGGVHPAINELVEKDALPDGHGLVPGCGSGWDVIALANQKREVTGLDLSIEAVEKAKKVALKSPNSKNIKFLADDFFSFSSTEEFDFAFDYTFFCAIKPVLRKKWAEKYSKLLKPDGELITIIFPLGEYEGGPPFAVSFEAYEEVLGPLGFEAIEKFPILNSPQNRQGKEIFARWKRNSKL